MVEVISLFHRTSEESARAIARTGTWVSAENTGEVYGSTRLRGQAMGYGPAVVFVGVRADRVTLDDEFPDGEKHYRFHPRDAVITGILFDVS